MCPVNSLQSPRFCGIRTFMRQSAATDETPQADVSVIGVPFDSWRVVPSGHPVWPGGHPRGIHAAQALLPELDVDVDEHFSIADHGDIDTIPGYMEDSFAAITSSLTPFFCRKNPASHSGRRPQHKPAKPARRACGHGARGSAAL